MMMAARVVVVVVVWIEYAGGCGLLSSGCCRCGDGCCRRQPKSVIVFNVD